MKNKDELIAEINSKYDINVLGIEKLERDDSGHDNLILKLNCDEGVFLYKEIPSHSIDNNLDQIYTQINSVNPRSYRIVLPLQSKNQSFLEEIFSNKVMIYPFIDHTTMSVSDIPIEKTLSCLSHFHQDIQKLDIPTHPYKTYQNWFERGLSQTRSKINDHHFLDLFENFITQRFGMLDFKMGNIHFDLNPFNVWTTARDEIYFADLDTLQKGSYAKDLFDITAKYLNLNEDYAEISNSNLKRVFEFAQNIIPNVTIEDLRFLLSRPKLGLLFDASNGLSIDQAKKRLDHLLLFITSK